MKWNLTNTSLFLVFFIIFKVGSADIKEGSYGVYSFQHQINLPASPNEVYDIVTGDISPWWDHTFSEKPSRFYIDARPGGGFYEIFDDTGDGVRHAVVIFAQRGKILRLEGPLGLTGRAVQGIYTYTLDSLSADSTRLSLDVHLAGEINLKTAQIVESVWSHFIFDRLSPYLNSRFNHNPKGRE